ncbi:hypothetical protein NEMIN01_2078 [Nematocida minor]|uniref:uncharacterized protein n=1 Tax=Nematocida minor TaxID=1912983 RepID=UPI00221EAA60|nr:uncharacterized protein NEMIN01_2078 [Nematocida minor]KAI5192546.1 hypothetical protein NEMIN01_2078 [Nematocida minor]
MRANDLLEIEERISNLLKEEEKKKGEKQDMLRKIQESIKERQELCVRLEKEKKERIDRLNTQKEALEKAKSMVEEKENEEIKKKKEKLRRDYTNAINNVNELELVFSKDMTNTVEKILAMKKHAKTSGFNSLAHAVSLHLMEQMKEFIVESKALSKSIRVDKLIDLVKGLNRSIIMADSKYTDLEKRRELYVEGFFIDLEENFSHHFFGQFDTNRMDKPEWYLEYLINELPEYDKIFSVLSQIDELAAETEDEEFEQKNKEKYFHNLIDRIFTDIIYKKLNECVYSSSKQQKELIMHHAGEIGEFQREISAAYKYKDKPKILEKDLLYIQEVFVEASEKELHSILKQEYKEWSDLFMYLLKKIFKHAAALHSIIPSAHVFLLEAAIRKYLEGLSAFLNSFLYKKEEEQKILVYFIEEIAHLEEELLDIETEFGMAVGEITILKVPYLGKFKTNMLEILQRIIEEKIDGVMRPFSSYRFMDEQEEADSLSNLAEVLEAAKSLSEAPELSSWIEHAVGETVDECICQKILSAQIDGDSEIARIRGVVKSIADIFRENSIQYRLARTENRCKELFGE